MLLLERPWERQPTAPASVDFGSPFARGLVSCWASNGTIWYGPQDGTRTPLGIGDGTTVNSFGLASGPFTVISNTQNVGRFPDGSYGTNSAGTFIAAAKYLYSGTDQTLRGGNTNEMQLRVTAAGSLVFVKRAVSVRITAGNALSGESFIFAGSYGNSNRLYKNGVLLGVDTGNLVNSQGAAAWIGHDGSAAQDWLGSVAFVASWDRQLSDDEVAQVSANPWQLFAPRRIWVPVSAGGGGATNLTVAEASHGHTADSLVLSTQTALTVADATHAHTADAPTLTLQVALVVAEASHGHTADNITLTTVGQVTLTVDDATHAHAADAPVLSSELLLAIADALHGHAADNLTLTLTGADTLVIQRAVHAHTADAPAFTLQVSLTVADATHGHSAANVLFGDALTLIYKILTNRQELDPATGTFTIYDDDGVSVLFQSNAWADAAGTIPYSGGALMRIDKLQ